MKPSIHPLPTSVCLHSAFVAAVREHNLQHFQAANCELGPKAGESLRRLLQRDKSRGAEYAWLNDLRDGESPLVDTTHFGLIWCDLSFNRLGNAGLEHLTRALGDDSPLLILDVRANGISLDARPRDLSVPVRVRMVVGSFPLRACFLCRCLVCPSRVAFSDSTLPTYPPTHPPTYPPAHPYLHRCGRRTTRT